jgi:hypothetical protein
VASRSDARISGNELAVTNLTISALLLIMIATDCNRAQPVAISVTEQLPLKIPPAHVPVPTPPSSHSLLQPFQPVHREIARINMDGTGYKQLTFPDDPDYPDANASSISPDEKGIAIFSGMESRGLNQSVLTFGHRNVAVIPAAGGNHRLLTNYQPVTTQAQLDALGPDDPFVADDPVWSPDAKRITFHRGTKTGGQTWIMDCDGQNAKLLYPAMTDGGAF